MYEDVSGDSFDTGRIYMLPPPPPELKGYKVKELHESHDYHQTFLLSRKRTSCCEYLLSIIVSAVLDYGGAYVVASFRMLNSQNVAC